MPGRNYQSSTPYRYGMNGQECDDEITGNHGTHTTAEYWEYDTRLGRRWNIDPVDQVSISNYATFANNPILYTDVNGDVVDYGKKGEGQLRNKFNAWVARNFGKGHNEFAKKFHEWQTAKTDDGTDITYHLELTKDKPALRDGGEITSNSDVDKSVKYGNIGDLDNIELVPKEVNLDWRSQVTKTVSGNRDQPIGRYRLLTRLVPGSTITMDAESYPDNFTITDNGNVLYNQNIVDQQPRNGNNYLNIGVVGRGTFIVPSGTSNVTMKVSSFRSWPKQTGRPAQDNTSKWSYTFTRFQGLRIHFKYYEVKKIK